MVDFLAYSSIRAAESAGLKVGDLAFTTGPASVDGSPTGRCGMQFRRTKDRKNGGGCRAAGERYAVPLDWSQPLAMAMAMAMGAFYDTIFRPAVVAVGLPSSAPADGNTAAPRGVRLRDIRHTLATMMQLLARTHLMQASKWLFDLERPPALSSFGASTS